MAFRTLARLLGPLVALLVAAALPAQPAAPTTAADSAAGAPLRVYLVTMDPGDQVWERFGHNALWIHDPVRGTDLAYNWGIFDFDQADFVPRLLAGHMLYSMGGFDMGATLAFYRQINRTVTAQELALTPAQKRELQAFVEWNALPENAPYLYDYYRDNCSTRVRDVLDRVLGGTLRQATAAVPSGTTYRWHTRRLLGGALPASAGTDVALGHPVDRPISRWEEMFIPMKLREGVRAVRVADVGGAAAPLVRAETTLFQATRDAELAAPPNRFPLFVGVGLALAALIALLARAATTGSAAARRGFVAVGTTWGVVAGVLGVLLTLLWTATDHVYTYRNENLFQFNPLPLALAVLLPLLRKRPRFAPAAARVALVIAGLSLAGLALQALPGVDQTNGEAIALALPVHLALAWGAWRLATARAHEPRPAGAAAAGTLSPPRPSARTTA